MELKISCDASIKLDRMSNIVDVEYDIKNYKTKKDTLDGNVIIKGKYIKDVIEEEYDFTEQVPFTVVFKNEKYKINSIEILDFNFQEIINQGIECNFNILIKYEMQSLNEDDGLKPNEEIKPELNYDDIDPLNEYKQELELEDELPGEPAESEELIDSNEDNLELNELDEIEESLDSDDDNELVKSEINQKYDDLLQKILNSRDDNFLEDDKVNFVPKDDRGIRGIFSHYPETYTSYKVYYPAKENELEKICKKENISIEKIYRDNRNNDYLNKKRIIIK